MPFITPHSLIASIMYAEHVGWNLQEGPSKGEIAV